MTEWTLNLAFLTSGLALILITFLVIREYSRAIKLTKKEANNNDKRKHSKLA